MNYRMFSMIFVVLVPVSGSFCVRPTAARSLFGVDSSPNRSAIQKRERRRESPDKIRCAQQLLKDIKNKSVAVAGPEAMIKAINAYALLKNCREGRSSRSLTALRVFIQDQLSTPEFSCTQELIYYAAKNGIKSSNL